MRVIAECPGRKRSGSSRPRRSPSFAIYGRRRVGRTLTLSQTMREKSRRAVFRAHWQRAGGRECATAAGFSVRFLHRLAQTDRGREKNPHGGGLPHRACGPGPHGHPRTSVYLFLDELLPWIARSAPRFLSGPATLWNNSLSKKLFMVGSATSWAKPVTAKIHMRSLDLARKTKRSEQLINYCFIVRNRIKRNRCFNEINPVVADRSHML